MILRLTVLGQPLFSIELERPEPPATECTRPHRDPVGFTAGQGLTTAYNLPRPAAVVEDRQTAA